METRPPSTRTNWRSVLQERGVGTSRAALIIALTVLLIWLGAVIFTTAHHEYRRDEVRAWSMARAAATPIDLLEITQYDGHPPLWFAILYIGNAITHSPLVLPVASITIALVAVIIFMFLSPFPLWIKILFLFGVLPFYEYSVMARNYGVSMLLLFMFAAFYCRRARNPLAIGIVLALLANANVHSTILAGILGGVWVWDTQGETHSLRLTLRRLTMALGILLVGVTLSLWSTFPKPTTVLTDLGAITAPGLLAAVVNSTIHTSRVFSALSPDFPGIVFELLLLILLLGLLVRLKLFLAAWIAQISLGVVFSLVYPGVLRHQGLFLVFLIVLYWVAMDNLDSGSQPARGWVDLKSISHTFFSLGNNIALPAILLGCLFTAWIVLNDIRRPLSSSQAFGAFLAASPDYKDAILVPDPDYYLESLPYYADNLIYFPRESRTGDFVSWTTASNTRLSLDDLLSTAYSLQRQYQRPVLIVLGHRNLDHQLAGEIRFSYNKIFTWDSAENQRFEHTTRLVARFDRAWGDENYFVYKLR